MSKKHVFHVMDFVVPPPRTRTPLTREDLAAALGDKER